MTRHLPLVLALAALAGLALHAFEQHRALAVLRADLDALREQSTHADRAPPPITLRAAPPPASAATTTATAPRAASPTPAAPPPAPRAPVSGDEIARVESAMLSLLESDRPELQEKLRAVVQEQQEALMHDRQEVMRERWVARTEARLAELTGTAALSEAQRRAIVDILLGNRDQIADVMRNAETSKDFAAARETRRRLRAEADARVRELLTAPQYEGFKQAFEDDDDRDRRGPPQR
jgi:hypothetical protein